MNAIAPDIGIDLGTSNTLVYVRKRGIQINEPTLLVVSGSERRTIKAIGQDALALVGRTSAGDVAVRPLQDGTVKDFDLTEAILRYFIRSHPGFPFDQTTCTSDCPIGFAGGKSVIREAAISAGAKNAIHLIDKPLPQPSVPACRYLLGRQHEWTSAEARLR